MTEQEMRDLRFGLVLTDPFDGEVVMALAAHPHAVYDPGNWDVVLLSDSKTTGAPAGHLTTRTLNARWRITDEDPE